MTKRDKNGRFVKGSSGFTGKHTEESKLKMSNAKRKNPIRYWLGKQRSPETLKKISDSLKGRKAWNKGLKKTWKSPGDFKKGHTPIHKDKTYEEAYGIKDAKKFKQQLSKVHTERPNRYWLNKERPEISGSNSKSWKGGHVKYYGKSWPRQRKLTLKRDKNICQECRGKIKLVVHHRKPVRQFWLDYKKQHPNTKLKQGEIIELLDKDINDLRNLITLCENKDNNCHRIYENGYNKK